MCVIANVSREIESNSPSVEFREEVLERGSRLSLYLVAYSSEDSSFCFPINTRSSVIKIYESWRNFQSQPKKTNNSSARAGLCVRKRDKELTMTKISLFILLLMTIVSGCSLAISNSESYYQNIPRQPINWREYMTD
jgi:hypothetical protein